jgi:hypothetical protein
MAVARWKIVAAPLVMLGLGSPVLVSCDNKPRPVYIPLAASALPPSTESCDEIRTGSFAEIPIAAPGDAVSRIRSLLTQSSRLMLASVALEKELIDACTVLGKGAGAFDEELKGKPDNGHGAEHVCGVAVTKASKILKDAKDAKVGILLEFDSPHCLTPIETTKNCLAQCGSPVPKGDDRVSCTGGEIVNTCRGRCGGFCANDAGPALGACYGVCTGNCDKEFRGTCGGKCNGTCNGTPTRGPHRCAGVCDGSCTEKAEGICGGKCDGACNGPWAPKDQSKCAGVCNGTCAGEAMAPLCSGEFLPKGADTACLALCGSAATLAARCDAPLVRLTVKGGKQNAELQKLLTGMQAALPRIFRVQEGLARKLPRSMESVGAAVIDWSNAYATSGPKALSCLRAAIDGVKDGALAIDTASKGSEAIKPMIQPLLKPADPPPPPPDP